MNRVFLLSPALASGVRMQMLLRPGAEFPLARAVQGEGAKLGEAFAFASGLYFRGKLAYARAFAQEALVITPGWGLASPEVRVRAADLRAIGEVPVDLRDERYRLTLERDARLLASRSVEVVLLGSIASGKYADVLEEILGDRLLFPPDFIGRGDMSRGGLLLRCVREGKELPYRKLRGAERHGARPPRLPRLRSAPAGSAPRKPTR